MEDITSLTWDGNSGLHATCPQLWTNLLLLFKHHTVCPGTPGHSPTNQRYRRTQGKASQAALLTLPHAQGPQLTACSGAHGGTEKGTYKKTSPGFSLCTGQEAALLCLVQRGSAALNHTAAQCLSSSNRNT